jgi:uncharacterized protein DUF2637
MRLKEAEVMSDAPRVITQFRAWGPAAAAGLALATVAAVTGFISYTHICALTLQLHQSWKTAHLMPLAVDGQIVVGSVVLLTGRGRAAWWGWLGVAPGLAESLFANWESGIVHGHLAAIWATVPAQAFAVASFMFERWLKAQVSQAGQGGQSDQDSDRRADSESHANTCPHRVVWTVNDAVIQAFLHERDCMGKTPSQRQLAKQFEISRPRVAELVTPYRREGDEDTDQDQELAA